MLELSFVFSALNFSDVFLLFLDQFTYSFVEDGALGLSEDLNFAVFERAVDMVNSFSQFVLGAREGR